MGDIPSQIDRRVRRAIAALDRPWQIIKKRDHYFLQVEDAPLICVGNNSSKRNDWKTARALDDISKL